MTTKKKIIISVTAAVLVIAVAIVGVFAAQSTQVGITNTVSFAATSVNARVEVYAVQGSTPISLATSGTSGFNQGTGVATYTFAEATETKTANLEDITLTVENPSVTYTIYIYNTGSKAFNVTATGLDTAGTNLTITSTVVSGAATDKAGADALTGASTLTRTATTNVASSLARDNVVKVTITAAITDNTKDASANFSWLFTMASVA